MISLPPEKIREKIRASAKLSDSEIDARIDDKLKSLSGLISRDGALHIIANELGVKLMPDREKLRVKDLLVGMKVQLNLRVLKVYELREFNKDGREGKVSSFLGGDETGVLRVTLWNEHAPLIKEITEGNVVQVREASVRENQGRQELHLGTGSTMLINPVGVSVEVNNTTAQERNYTKRKISELGTSDEFVDILGTVVQVFDPRGFTKKTGEQGLVANVVIEDGSGDIRASFWDDDCRALLGEGADKPDKLADIKLELLGNIIKVQGRCKLNPAYNQVELSVNRFQLNPDPKAEMDRLG